MSRPETEKTVYLRLANLEKDNEDEEEDNKDEEEKKPSWVLGVLRSGWDNGVCSGQGEKLCCLHLRKICCFQHSGVLRSGWDSVV